MDLPEYVSIPLVLVIFIAMILLFAALLYCCRWFGESRDRPVMDIGHEVEDGPSRSTQKRVLLNKTSGGKCRFPQWNTKFFVYKKQAWLRQLRKKPQSINNG